MNGKQLKNSILQWAIQGKLVPQDPNDEPASVLLERIRKEKERLVKEKKIKKDKNASIIFRGEDNSYYEKFLAKEEVKCIDEEIPFEIPENWMWVRLESICTYIQRGKSPKYSLIKRYPVVAQKCNQWSGFSIEKAQFIEPKTLANYSKDRILQDEDLMWNSTGLGTLGRMAIYYARLNPYELAVADSHVTVIRLLKQFTIPKFFYFYFASPAVQSVIENKADGSTKQKELSTATVCSYLIPLPPIDEQKRIVNLVDSISPLVVKYGKQQSQLDNLNIETFEALKKSILQEAIQGKLVPQIQAEGTAEELLAKIRKEKELLVKEGKLKKFALTDSVIFKGDDNKYYEKIGGKVVDITDEMPFEIPDTWAWARIGILFAHNNGKQLNKSNSSGRFMEYITTSNLYWDGFKLDNLKKMPFEKEEIERCQAIKGDLLVCEGGDVGRACIWEYDFPIMLQNHIHKLRAYYPLCTKYFYYIFYLYNKIGIIGGKGIGIQGFSAKALHNTLVPLPPLSEQKRICSRISELFGKIKA